MAIDVKKEIRRAVDTGEVIFGEKTAEKSILKGIGKVIILSNNLDVNKKENFLHFAELAKIPVMDFDGSSVELGALCGKPFIASVLVIVDQGKSNILSAVK